MRQAKVEIRPMVEGDVRAAASIHHRAFSGFFLAQLGESVLRQFYRASLRVDDCISLVALDGDTLVGVVTGTSRSKNYFLRVVRARLLQFVGAVVLATWYRPLLAVEVLRRLRASGNTKSQVRSHVGLLSSICVSPDSQRHGAGAALLDAFEDECRTAGQGLCRLTTDASENFEANGWYVRHGWVLVGRFEGAHGRAMNVYEKRLAEVAR